MADIFISYTSKDRDRVIPILKALEKQGWFLFCDWTSIPNRFSPRFRRKRYPWFVAPPIVFQAKE